MVEESHSALAAGQRRLVHRTVYRYARPVWLGPQTVRLRPLPMPGWPAPGYSLRVTPEPLSLRWQADVWGNQVARMVLPGPTEALALEVSLVLETEARNPFDFLLEPAAQTWPFRYDTGMGDALGPFRKAEHAGPLLAALVAETAQPGPTVDWLLALAGRVVERVAYMTRMQDGVWPPDLTLAEGRGSCRDSAWLLVQALRLHGVAARFVSGYLVQADEAEGRSSELHAWVEAFLPGAGWVGVDATSGLLTAEGHVALAAAPEPEGAAPLSGTVEATEVRLEATIEIVEGPIGIVEGPIGIVEGPR